MKYVTQFTVKQVCDILSVTLPSEYSYMEDDSLTNIACSTSYLTEGGAYFLVTKKATVWEGFLKKAIAAKVKIVFVCPECRKLSVLKQIPHIVVDNVFECLIRISQEIRNSFNGKVIGITGSVGKTTTKEMICSVLKQRYTTAVSPGNLNTIYHLTETIQKLDPNNDIFVQEFGAGVPTADTLSKSVRGCQPDIGIITNIFEQHLDVFGTCENILEEKLNIVRLAPVGTPIFLNYDNELLKNVKLNDHPIVSYAVNNKQADYYAENIQASNDYMTFDIVHKGCSFSVRLNAYGIHNVGNALVAAAVGEWLGLTQAEIVAGIAAYKGSGIRQSLTDIGGYKLYIDCFNTSSVALKGAIKVVEQLNAEKKGKSVAVITEIRSLGERSADIHRELAESIGQSDLDLVLCFGNEDAKLMADVIHKYDKAVLYTDNRECLNYLVRQLITKNDITLYKGAHPRMLHKTIDQVYGTALHINNGGEYHKNIVSGDYKVRICSEEDGSGKLAALTKYSGDRSELVLPAEINSVDVFSVANNCFFKNEFLTEVVIPAPICNISSGAFRACKKLAKVTLPETLKIIGAKAFRYCSALEEIVIPEGVIDVGDEAFLYCKSLKRVVLPSTLGRIGENAFPRQHKVNFEVPAGSYAEKYIQKNDIR